MLILQDVYNVSKMLQGFDHPCMCIQYRAAILISFYAFLRISNIVPPTLNTLDSSRQLCYEDVTFTHQGVTLYLKWAKNLQKTENKNER